MNKISLCMIVGNVDDYIERCLLSFLPIADEVVIVQAIGNQQPDRTMELAERLCRLHNKPIRVGKYNNAHEHADWPHVDNFAAARQLSFDLATSEYCFWCDSDDILVSGAENIRKHAQAGEFACFIFKYDIFGKNVVVDRERMMLKESGHWENAVHECFKFKVARVTAGFDDGVVIQHLPRLDKGDREIARGGVSGNQRNLRILESIPPEQLTAGLKYHLFGELICAGRKTEAIKLSCEMLQGNELGKDERYDLLMSLVLQATDMEHRIQLSHEAHRVDPERREALGVLACFMMDMERPRAALAYARQMMATPEPEIPSWNSRKPFYSYTGDDIFQQALRVNGKVLEAEAMRRESMAAAGGPRIALVHASRGRPEMASKCRKAWHDLAAQPGRVEHIFAIDEDDNESAVLQRFNHVKVPAGGGCVRAWNFGSFRIMAPIIVQMSDDWIPVPKWDDLICDRIGDPTQPRVLAISDGARTDNLLCMAICTRNYFAQDWFLFHPDFLGVYSDNWFTEQAYARGQVIEARDIVFTHNHPAFGKAEVDKTYETQNSEARYAQGLEVILRLRAGKDWSSVPGFFNYWLFYENVADCAKDGDTLVEVGCWLGRSIIYLAQRLKKLGKTNCKLIAVDWFKGEINQPDHKATVQEHGGNFRAAFEANIERCGVRDMITIIDGDSAASASQLSDATVDFCYIDAAHDYESVKRDIQAWLPKIKPGGTISGHDAQHEPVVRAVEELLPNHYIAMPVWLAKV